MGPDHVGEALFRSIQAHRGLVFSIRQRRQVVDRTIDPDELFDKVVPWRDVLVVYGPWHAVAIATIGLEMHRTHAIRMPTPHQRAAAQVVTAHPEKAAFRRRLVDVDIVIDE